MPKINCPHCGSKIPYSKTRCPFCRNEITPSKGAFEPCKNKPPIDISAPSGVSSGIKDPVDPGINQASQTNEIFDWKQLQRYVLASKPLDLTGSYNSHVINMLEKLQLPRDETNLVTFAKDCQYLFTMRPNLNLGIRNSLLKKYEESILTLEQVSLKCPDLPKLRIQFNSHSKLGVKNILSFLK